MTSFNIKSFLYLLMFTFVGFFLGNYIAPEVPLSPFLPQECESQSIKIAELYRAFVVGVVVSIIAMLSSLLLKCGYFHAIIATLIVGAASNLLDFIKFGELSTYNLKWNLAFFCGLIVILGLIKVFEATRN